MSDLKRGYKQTEVGVIPEDWEARSIRNLAAIKTGPFGTLLKADEYSGHSGVPLVSVGEIGVGTFRITDDTPLVPEAVLRRLPQYILRSGDIVFGRKGAVDRSALVTTTQDGWFLGSDGIGIRPSNQCHPAYLSFQFQCHAVQSWLLQNAVGTTMASLNQDVLGRVTIPFAPLPEQRAIAGVLGDVDALIGALDRLIAKKRDLKQAAMQQLLTGQTRLPGFIGKWAMSTVGREFEIQLGKMLDADRNVGIPKPYLGNRSVQWGRIDLADLRTVRMTSADLERYRLKKGDLLVCEGGEIGRAAIWGAPIEECYYQKALHRLRPTRGYGPYFMLALLGYWVGNGLLADYVTQTSIAHLTREKLAVVPLPVPEQKEQSAIASVLSDMDSELSALEERRNKTHQLKQGMMQELLTGRTRLS